MIFRVIVLLLAVLLSFHCKADQFVYEGANPPFKITIPNVPQMKMDVHPLHNEQPHLRYMGTSLPFTVSILTPTADKGMTPVECAQSNFGHLTRRPGVPPREQVFMARINDSTYVAIYAVPQQGAVMLHAHFVSAAMGTHCIEVHVSKASRSPDDVDPWFKGFGNASFEVN